MPTAIVAAVPIVAAALTTATAPIGDAAPTITALHSYAFAPIGTVLLCAGSDSMDVMAKLLVVGVMDAARDDILGDGNISLSLVESLSQVYCLAYNLLNVPAVTAHLHKTHNLLTVLAVIGHLHQTYSNTMTYMLC